MGMTQMNPHLAEKLKSKKTRMQSETSRNVNKKDKNPHNEFDILMESSKRIVKKE
jgi:hypothetical protein